MKRTQLVNFKFMQLTPDTAQALWKLDLQAKERGLQVSYGKPPDGGAARSSWVLSPAGRSVRIRVRDSEGAMCSDEALSEAWQLLTPLGFTPWNRHPVQGPDDDLFHFLGPWRPILDRLASEGMAHLAWPSLCAAAQTDVGTWNGSCKEERFIQAQLHRIGVNCGPVDGILGERTLTSIKSIAQGHLPHPQLADYLRDQDTRPPKRGKRRIGHLVLPGFSLSVSSFGGVQTARNHQGALFTVDGPGRIIIDVRNN